MNTIYFSIIAIVLVAGGTAFFVSSMTGEMIAGVAPSDYERQEEGEQASFKSMPFQRFEQVPSYGLPKKLRYYEKKVMLPSPYALLSAPAYQPDGRPPLLCFTCRTSYYIRPYAREEGTEGVCIVRQIQYGEECVGVRLHSREPCVCPKPSQEQVMRFVD